MTPVALTAEQLSAFAAIESSTDHVFVTGRAGTGKSTVLQHLARNTDKNLVLCAPTGVAALNIGGQTIHSLFRFPIGVIGDHEFRHDSDVRKLLNTIDTLVIDEISMVSADLMDAIDRCLRESRRRPLEAFGGVQVVLFGDPYQLAPVPASGDEAAYLADQYRSLWFFDARVWRDAPLRVLELDTVHRQPDPVFTAMLNAVRHGTVTQEIANALNAAGARTPPGDRSIITLATRNATVNRINAQSLAKLPGESRVSQADINGDFGGRALPADENLELRVGAQVMFLRNDADGRWVNGSTGTVQRIDDAVHVDMGGDVHEVGPVTWEKYKYSYDPGTKDLSRDVVAEFTQFPLRLAWAVTIHKSQGKTLDEAIIDLGPRAFSAGQSYVALSRLTGIDGLYLTRPLRPSDVIVDADVARFMAESTRVSLPMASSRAADSLQQELVG